MHAHILVTTDGSDLGHRALDQAIAIAKAIKSYITVIPRLIEAEEKAANELLDKGEAKAKAAGLSAKTSTTAGEGIVATANYLGADLIIKGSPRGCRGLGACSWVARPVTCWPQTKTPVLVTR